MHVITKTICIIVFTAGILSAFPEKESPFMFHGNRAAIMKTSNGCWDIYNLIINRGDSIAGISASIGYGLGGSYQTYQSFSTNHLLDFDFYEYWTEEDDLSYFVIVKENNLILYSIKPDQNITAPVIAPVDSISTPAGYLNLAISHLELLVVNRVDSVNFAYSFYDLPDMNLDTQLILNLEPDKLVYQFEEYVIVGIKNGENELMILDDNSHQPVYHIKLPNEANNTREFVNDFNFYTLLSSPQDSSSHLIKINKSDTTITVTTLLPNTGINASALMNFNRLLIQPTIDIHGNGVERQLLKVNYSSGVIEDTIAINKIINRLHYKPQTFGTSNDYFIFSLAPPNDTVVWYNNNTNRIVFQAGANPTWFTEDYRCYVGVEQIEKNLDIKVFPNPTSDYILIKVTGLVTGKNYNFEILDVSGKQLWNMNITAKEEYSIPLHTFPKGMLLLRIDAGSRIITRKIMKL